ncbi:hypothetical protein M9458_052245, partial [Cirrhinus mrigala]
MLHIQNVHLEKVNRQTSQIIWSVSPPSPLPSLCEGLKQTDLQFHNGQDMGL